MRIAHSKRGPETNKLSISAIFDIANKYNNYFHDFADIFMRTNKRKTNARQTAKLITEALNMSRIERVARWCTFI